MRQRKNASEMSQDWYGYITKYGKLEKPKLDKENKGREKSYPLIPKTFSLLQKLWKAEGSSAV